VLLADDSPGGVYDLLARRHRNVWRVLEQLFSAVDSGCNRHNRQSGGFCRFDIGWRVANNANRGGGTESLLNCGNTAAKDIFAGLAIV